MWYENVQHEEVRILQKKTVARVLLLGLLLFELALIFKLSNEPAPQSDTTSADFTEQMLAADSDFLASSQAERDARVQALQKGIRTLAHFAEYTLLGLTAAALALTMEKRLRGTAIAVLFCVLWAVSDEVHQSFIPGRSCQVSDVAVDSAGILLGACAVWAVFQLVQTVRKKRKDECNE